MKVKEVLITVAVGGLVALAMILLVQNRQLKMTASDSLRAASLQKQAAASAENQASEATRSATYKTSDAASTATQKSADFNQDEVLVQHFFNTMYTYNTASFMSRFNKAKKYAADQPIQLLIGTGGQPEQPPTTIESKLEDLGFYPDSQAAASISKDKTYQALVTVKFHFQYQGQDTDSNVTYKVTIDRNAKKITDMWVRNEQGDYR